MFSVFFYNLDMTHYFTKKDAALEFAMKSGFQCVVNDVDNNQIAKFSPV
jgi:hypothetical protein